ncbi:MAG: hypothetical protein AAGC68_06305 [Verrucomicrobiota bacterium]
MALSREFLQTWQSTQDTWQDQKAREFDVSYMQPLFDSVDNAVAAIEDLDKVLHQLRKDCEIE